MSSMNFLICCFISLHVYHSETQFHASYFCLFKGSRARALYKAGLRTPLAIAEASVTDIVIALFDSSRWTSQG